MKRIVTVDGPAGSGKSTIAKLLANRINYTYLDTGSLYRAATYLLLQQNVTPKDNYKIAHALKEAKIDIDKEKFFLDGNDVTEELRTEVVNQNVAAFAQNAEIRQHIRNIQLKLAGKEEVIVDGRDIGTVVFPDAFCKFYLDASAAVRAERRLNDEKEDSSGKDVKEIEKEIRARDDADKSRKISPLKIPVDALVIDTSKLQVDDVMEKMIQFFNKKVQEISSNFMMSEDESNMFLQAMDNIDKSSTELETGDLLKGKIIKITDTGITLDIGEKRDAIIDESEINKINKESMKVGDTIDVYLKRGGGSQIVVSKLEADKRSALIEIKEIFEKGEQVEGEVTHGIKGGFLVDIKGNSAFCPFSEYDVKRVNKEKQQGVKSPYQILEFNNSKIVVSRKRPLEVEYKKIKEEFFSTVREGDVLEGTVVNTTDFGAFVEIREGVTALIRNKNLAWTRFDKIEDVVKRGDIIKGRVIQIKEETFKLELSKKDAEEDPIIVFSRDFAPGTSLKGEVRNLESFGAFIEVAKGVEGLLHISEMSWTKRINHPNEVLNIGDFVEVKLLSVDVATRKVSLGMKQVVSNPWDTIEQQYPEGSVVRGIIKSIIKNGVYLEIEKEFEGFIHIGDISWTKERINTKDKFNEGDEIEAKVIGHNREKRRIELGLKQKTANPWNDLKANYGINGVVKAEVTNIIEQGAFAKVSDEIEGFCHISQLSRDKVDRVEDAVQVGKEYNFLIQTIDEENKKVSLSIKGFLNQEERNDIKQYLSGSDNTESVTLGSLIQQNNQ